MSEKSSKNLVVQAFRMGIELFSALVLGVGVGWALDHWLSTRPIFVVIFSLLGFAAGLNNVYKFSRQLQQNDKDCDHGGEK